MYESKSEFKLLYEYVEESFTVKDAIKTTNYKMSSMDAKILTAQLLLVLNYMEKQSLLHRNISPDNILLANAHTVMHHSSSADK